MKTLHILICLLWALAGAQYGCRQLPREGATPEAALEREKAAIRRVVDLETTAYYQQDFPTWRSTFLDTSYFRSYGYWEGYPEKVRVYNGFDALEAFKKKQFVENRTLWQGSVEEKSNENFRIYPGVAWYTYDQVSYDLKTRKLLGKSVETRILEKHDGQWKIAYQNFQYLPLDTLAR